jgi:hypothetical protein
MRKLILLTMVGVLGVSIGHSAPPTSDWATNATLPAHFFMDSGDAGAPRHEK